jgi:hypothetical protein
MRFQTPFVGEGPYPILSSLKSQTTHPNHKTPQKQHRFIFYCISIMAMADPPPPVADGAPPTGFAAAAAADMGHPQVGQGGGVAIAGGSGRGGGWEGSCRCFTPFRFGLRCHFRRHHATQSPSHTTSIVSLIIRQPSTGMSTLLAVSGARRPSVETVLLFQCTSAWHGG